VDYGERWCCGAGVLRCCPGPTLQHRVPPKHQPTPSVLSACAASLPTEDEDEDDEDMLDDYLAAKGS
jgi:hypothetical protein